MRWRFFARDKNISCVIFILTHNCLLNTPWWNKTPGPKVKPHAPLTIVFPRVGKITKILLNTKKTHTFVSAPEVLISNSPLKIVFHFKNELFSFQSFTKREHWLRYLQICDGRYLPHESWFYETIECLTSVIWQAQAIALSHSPLHTVNQLQYEYALHLNTPRRVFLHFVRFSSYQW